MPQAAHLAREAMQIRIEEDPYGDCPPPVRSFEELHVLPEFVVRGLTEHGITSPMPIQAQALPLVLSGRNVIGLAQTGSGKTLAFLLPAVVHAEAQPPIPTGQEPATPIALVLAPTRELAVQIAEEAEKVLAHSSQGRHPGGLRAACVFGGADKFKQARRLWWGAHFLVATPGRLIDFISSNVVSLQRVTYVVLDEADRMLDMGFQGDVAMISAQVRPERQVLFFSATWNNAVQGLAMGLCQDGAKPVRISYGEGGDAGMEGGGASARRAREGITQEVVVVDDAPGDWDRQATTKRTLLVAHLRKVLGSSDEHKVLVFVSQKNVADDLAAQLKRDGFEADAMHGGKSQEYRLWVLDQFRRDRLRLLVCTDVLGRGIDIPSVSHVVVHEMGYVEDYIHRIGRTARGRDGKGHALVFFEYWDREPKIAAELIDVLEASAQHVPSGLRKIADDVASGRRRPSR